MLCVGLTIFSGLYSTQALLPTLHAELALSSTQAAMTVSAATGALALCVVPASILSERFGRGRVLVISALAAGAMGLVVPLADDAPWLITLRFIQGAFMSGAPAVAMAWLSEELDSHALPRAMGIYIAGTSIGGLSGRIIPTTMLALSSWRTAMVVSAVISLLFAVACAVLLPAQRNFHPKEIHVRSETAAMLTHWRNPQLGRLFIVAFLAMGAFVSVYNFISFRLIHSFGMSPALSGAMFLLYLSGTWSSAQAGRLVGAWGRRRTLVASCALMAVGTALTVGPLWLTVAGMLALTIGFFAAHSVASGWVGAVATEHRAEASSMYVFCYYLGSSVVGAGAGMLFGAAAWPVFVACLAGLCAALTALAYSIRG